MSAARAAAGVITDAARLGANFARAPRVRQYPTMIFDPEWSASGGAGVAIGLIDCAINLGCPDLIGADIVVRDFVGTPDKTPANSAHGTGMAKLLVGQGREHLRGVVPGARLYAARVVGPADTATAIAVAAAINWMMTTPVRVVAMPIGSEYDADVIRAAIGRGVARGVEYFAACGSGAGAMLFPARYPAVIAVGPCDLDGRLAADARRMPQLDLLAPGVDIPGISGTGKTVKGSSIATVFAAGAAALAAQATLPRA